MWGASDMCKGQRKLGYIPYGVFDWLAPFQSYSTGWDKGGHTKLTQIRDYSDRPLQWLQVTFVTFCTSFYLPHTFCLKSYTILEIYINENTSVLQE